MYSAIKISTWLGARKFLYFINRGTSSDGSAMIVGAFRSDEHLSRFTDSR